MRRDAQAEVNPGRFLAALVLEELRRQGLRFVVACPGARNQPLLAALAARPDLERRIVVDERAAGHLALGWLRGQAAAGAAPVLAAVITTSGSAPLLLAPALAEARAAGLPLLLLSADRPGELHGVGANQTLDQTSPLRPLLAGQRTLAAYIGGAQPRDALLAASETARLALAAPGGPGQLNLALRDPLAPDPLPLPDGWREQVADWDASEEPWTWQPAPARLPDPAVVRRLRDEAAAARRPLVLVAGLERDADRQAARRLVAWMGAPWLADAGSGLRLGPHDPNQLFHADWLTAQLACADLVLQIGRRPVSRRVSEALAGCRRWLVDDHPEGQDPQRQGGVRIAVSPAEFAAGLGAQLLQAATVDPDWSAELHAADDAIEQRLVRLADDAEELSEAWITRELARRLGPREGLFVGNSLPVRHLDTLTPPRAGPGAVTATSRGTSGIEGSVAQAVGYTLGLGAPAAALLGDLTVAHDLSSLALLSTQQAPLLVVAIQNGGGGIFRLLPCARYPELLEPWLTTPQPVDLAAAARACGVAGRRIDSRAAFDDALRAWQAAPEPLLLEVVVDPEGQARLWRQLA